MEVNNIVTECRIMYDMLIAGYFNDELSNEERIKLMKQLTVTTTPVDFFDLPFFKKNQKIYEMMVDKLSGKNEANNAPPCGVCGSDRFYVDLQRRAGDEARNFEIHCPGCGGIQYI